MDKYYNLKYIIAVIFIILTTSLVVKAQQHVIYGVYWDNAISTEYLASLDLGNGTITAIDSLPGMTSYSSGSSTFNNIDGEYLIKCNLGIITVDVQTGAVLDTFASIFNFGEFEFDSVSKMVYGVYWDNTNSKEYIASLDLNNGTITPINSLPGVMSISSGSSTFNHIDGEYIIKCNLGIITIDVQSGAVLDTFASIFNFGEFEFDSVSKMVYGVYWDNTNSKEYIASLNLNNGTITPISSLPGVTSISLSTSTFNHIDGEYIIKCNLGIITIDIQTGAVLDTFASIFNFGEFEYTWSVATGMNEYVKLSPSVSTLEIFPNPTDYKTFLRSETPIQRVIIFNMQGQKIHEIEFNNQYHLVLDTQHLVNGVYILLAQTNSSLLTRKLIIEK